jgi:DNA-binding NtrC family response regulator
MPSPSSSNRSNSKSILVIDDESDIVNLVNESLRTDRFKVRTFTDPTAALEHFKSNSKDYDIVISDIRIPAMNGYQFVKHVKERNPKVKVILMTAFENDNKEFHNVLSAIKVDAFLQKPFSIQQLNNVLEKISKD